MSYDYRAAERTTGKFRGRVASEYNYAAMILQGQYVSGYAFSKYMDVPYWKVKYWLRTGKLKAKRDQWGEAMIPNPALDPQLVDAEWDPLRREFVTMFPGLRSEGMIG